MAVRNKPLGRIDVNVIDDIWKGSIDMHIHPGPDPLAERPVDSIQAAQMAERSNGRNCTKKFFL